MPKAKPFSDDDEKTTIESDSQWGDEASTTVEQGEVAEKVRALDQAPIRAQVITNVTNTSGIEEPTVDDQAGNPLLMTPPVLAPAMLIVTGGNDSGLEHAIAAGNAFTIDRGLDNDIVLTDIAVSRKHFDLRNDGGSWVIVDRGSGNGTVVNGNLEDNPFMLANGDVIEIGNTTFRFDFQVADVPRHEPFDPDDEMSTVAGKPLNAKMLDSIDVQMETPRPAARVTASRPKTLPPPTPLRPRSMTQPPAVYPSQSMPQMSPQQGGPLGTPSTALPATTLPMPQMQNRQPLASGPQAPTMLSGEPINLANLMPTTIPGGMHQPNNLNPSTLHHAGAMAPTMVPGGPLHPMYSGGGYPIAEVTPHAQMIVQSQNRRSDLSTAHVQPISYAPHAQMPPQRYSAVTPMEKRTKYVLALAAIAMVVLVVTIAIATSGGSGRKKPTIANGSAALNVTPIEPTKPVPPVVQPAQVPPKQEPAPPVAQAVQPPPKQDPPKQDPPKQDPPK
ncbi:MAG: FHA domain-containing protein, partial [Kofleriaceae bacterium]